MKSVWCEKKHSLMEDDATFLLDLTHTIKNNDVVLCLAVSGDTLFFAVDQGAIHVRC